jgi:hypothetical protein
LDFYRRETLLHSLPLTIFSGRSRSRPMP